MADLKVRLLPNRPSDGRAMPTRPLFQGMDFVGLKKRGQGTRSWIRIDTSGNSQVLEVDKATIMRRCDLPARDLRLLDPLFVYPSTILGREKAIVVNLEQIRCIITADEVLLLNSLDNFVLQYVTELQRRLTSRKNGDGHGFHWRSPGGQPVDAQLYAGQQKEDAHAAEDGWQRVVNDGDMFSGSSADDLPFEFRALEVAVEAACTYLDTQATELEEEAYPVLDELTSKISTLNLERVRRLKSRLVALTRRVQKVRDEIEHLMDDDGDMAEMYLTEKKQQQMEMFTHRDQPLLGHVSAPVSPVSSPDAYRNLERTVSFARSRHEGSSSSGSSDEQVQELEMLLEAYFVVIDGTLNKLTSLKEYIDDTEDFINIQLDNVRNQLIQFELLLTTATFVVAIFGVVAGVFGMNIPIGLFDEPWTFKWVLIITGLCGLVIFVAFLVFFKHRRLLSL